MGAGYSDCSFVAADVALLQCDRVPKSAIAAKLGDSDKVDTGDDIFIVGAPYGLSYTLTVGQSARGDRIIPAVASWARLNSCKRMLQSIRVTRAVPFNKSEEVIGIVSSNISESGEFQGVGFAATVNSARVRLLDGNGQQANMEGLLVIGTLARALNIRSRLDFW